MLQSNNFWHDLDISFNSFSPCNNVYLKAWRGLSLLFIQRGWSLNVNIKQSIINLLSYLSQYTVKRYNYSFGLRVIV